MAFATILNQCNLKLMHKGVSEGSQMDDPRKLSWIRNWRQHPHCTAISVCFTQFDFLLQKQKKKQRLNTPQKNVLLLHKSWAGFIYFKSFISQDHLHLLIKRCCWKTTTSLSASLSARLWALFEEARITACDGTQSVRTDGILALS